MQRALITPGPELLVTLAVDWDIDWRGQATPETLAGGSGTVYTGRPRWTGRLGLHVNADKLLAYRGTRWAGRGRSNIWRIPMVDPVGQSDLLQAAPSGWLASGGPLDTGQTLSTGMAMRYAPALRVEATAAKGATSLTVWSGGAPRGPLQGQILSHDDWPMGVTSVTAAAAADTWVITVEPPLRAAIPQGDLVELIAYGRFELRTEASGAPEYGRGFYGKPQIEFAEVLDR